MKLNKFISLKKKIITVKLKKIKYNNHEQRIFSLTCHAQQWRIGLGCQYVQNQKA